MPALERLVSELNRHMGVQDFDDDPELLEDLLDDQSEALNADGVGRNAMENEIDNLLAGGDFGDVLNGLQDSQGSQRHLLVENGAMTEMELLSNFDEVISYLTPTSGSSTCSASRLADNLFLTAAHCVYDKKDINKDTPVQSACVHPKFHNPRPHPMLPGTWFYAREYDIAVMVLNDEQLWSGKTVELAKNCPQPGDIQRLIGSGKTGQFNSIGCTRNDDPPIQRSGLTTVNEIARYAIRTERNHDVNNLSKNLTGVCGGDSGGFLGYLDEDSGQLSQTGVITNEGSRDMLSAVCGDSYHGDWVRNVSKSGSLNWMNDSNCQYFKYQEPLGPLHGPIDRPLHGPIDRPLYGPMNDPSNRGLGTLGTGIVIAIVVLLLAYIINKLSGYFGKTRTE